MTGAESSGVEVASRQRLHPSRFLLQGPWLILWIGLLSIVCALMVLWPDHTDLASLRKLVRVTASVSFLLFVPVATASAITRRWPGAFGRYLMRNRRYLGLGFGVAHLVHFGAILMLLIFGFDGDTARLGGMAGILPGVVIYVFLLLMMATSNDRAQRWLGARRWRVLHTLGIYALLIAFAKGFFLARDSAAPAYLPFQLLLVGILLLRLLARWRFASGRVPA